MIVFDLDGVLADCEHRRHLVDINKSFNHGYLPALEYFGKEITKEQRGGSYHKETGKKWKPDWDAFYEACDKDMPIEPVIDVFRTLFHNHSTNIEIWSCRSESVRHKTMEWLDDYLDMWEFPQADETDDDGFNIYNRMLKMRPIGDDTPDEQLKERWLDEYIDSMWPKLPSSSGLVQVDVPHRKDPVEYVFDSHPESICMWRRRGIFVFNCNQSDQ